MTTNVKNDNITLSKLKGSNLNDFLYFLKSFSLTLRNTLNIDKNDTFGLEIEFEDCPLDKALELFEKYMQGEWVLKDDGSIKIGGEINTPCMSDDTLFWYELDDVCRIISSYAASGEHTAGHVHIGGQIFKDEESILKFLKVWSAYEDIIFRFCYGEFESYRKILPIYAVPCAAKFISFYNRLEYSTLDEILSELYLRGGHCAVNFKIRFIDKILKKNTIEFRCPNGTINAVIWQNYVNTFTKLIYACNSNNLDMDLVDFRIKQNLFNTNGYAISLFEQLSIYNIINQTKAFEFCDLVFDNNLDKLYFLRQYYKDFENKNIFIKSKTFVK